VVRSGSPGPTDGERRALRLAQADRSASDPPLNSKAKITNLENGRSVIVTVNDRGPGLPYRAIDLSERAAQRLHMKKEGLATVKIEPVTPQSSQIALK
jgi:rare lipoprotein A